MLFAVFMVCVLELAIATLLLVLLGHRVRFSSRLAGIVLAAAAVYGAGRLAAALWSMSSGQVIGAQIAVFAVSAGVVLLRPIWNPVGQVFFGGYVAAALTYLAFAAEVTVAGGLSAIGSFASALLFVLEAFALFITATFAFETCDVICRTRHSRPFPQPDPNCQPFVSLHIPSYNEPPEMLIQTIQSAEAIDYPNFEIVVIDNNTTDPDIWRPVQEYCEGRERVHFTHVENLEGFKSGALNLALRELSDPRTELIGVVDSDYRIAPNYLKETAPYFAEPRLAFLQTPQDYREYEGNSYLTACYDAYRYFFSSSMPSRNERDSIIFAGTMGLLRKSTVEEIGGWDEWCITEDAEASLRMLRAGYSGLFIPRSYGQGIMPLTFASLKSQRFRWCFGGMQLLRKHWRTLMPWNRSPDNHLSIGQRLDYLVSSLQWMNDLAYLGFTIALVIIASILAAGHRIPIRPFVGPTVLLPAMLLASGLIRAGWALREREHLSYKRVLLAFVNWLSLSLTVARACVEGLVRPEGTFLRTPKTGGGEHRILAAVKAARAETAVALAQVALAVVLLVIGSVSPFVVALLFWQASVYTSSPLMSWLNQRGELTPELAKRKRTEELRERRAVLVRRLQAGTTALLGAGAVAFILVLALGAANPGRPSIQLPAFAPGNPGVSPARSRPPANNTTTTTTPSTTSTSTTGTTGSTTGSTTSTTTATTGSTGSGTTTSSSVPVTGSTGTTTTTTAPAGGT